MTMLCKPTGPLYRIGRADSPFHFSEISPDVSELPRAGNRFDVLGGGVLYAASTPTGAFVETLQSFRPTTAARAAVARDAPGLMIAGSVPRDWRERRRLARLTLEEPSPFIDVESSDAWPVLEDALAPELSLLGVSHIDVSIVRGSNRLVTRLLARWAYLASSASGEPAYGGVRYMSKLGPFECWAIFDGVQWNPAGQTRITKQDAAYREACALLELVAH
ncbi:Hypothetical protein ACGLYG10_1601 [Actinomyces glycerinitolerans]|uniref:RES domain-containing protein n=2 Tax=Actinomyces glycerinitolerans TaxID=1892869 RepID=A0A1M4RZG7_9ACTO|nr:Hypothetical protein ACGLYG10_1601 [Actinomyces glycerinitolerans]